MQNSSANEMGLIARILAGEKELFHELIRPYERMVYLTLFSIVRNETDAEDGAQEAVINAYRHLASFRGDAKFSTWLTSIAINEGRKRLRKTKGAGEHTSELQAHLNRVCRLLLAKKKIREVNDTEFGGCLSASITQAM